MKRHTNKELLESFAFLAPLALLTTAFIMIPVLGTLATSLHRDVVFQDGAFVFLDNYLFMIADPGFGQALGFTLLFTLVSVPLELAVGLGFALLLNRSLPGRGYIRAVILIPWAVPTAISARTWELIYNYSFGLANYTMAGVGLASEPLNWLGTSTGAFFALVVADLWKTAPFVAIILLAGLQAIPQELYRQADIDGAHFGQRFTRITLPLLKPVFIVAMLFRTIDTLRIFDLVFVLTHGGPGGTTTSLSMYSYNYFATGDFGYGSAVSVALFAVAFTLAIVYVKLGRFAQEVT